MVTGMYAWKTADTGFVTKSVSSSRSVRAMIAFRSTNLTQVSGVVSVVIGSKPVKNGFRAVASYGAPRSANSSSRI
jgi:hypothetical protein